VRVEAAQHAILARVAESYRLKDLNSTNGTQVNVPPDARPSSKLQPLPSSYCLFECAITRNDRLVGSPSRQSQRIEQFHEARLVGITHGGFAIWLDPFGMLDPQVVVNLLLELGVGVDLVRRGNWLGETNEFHKRPFIWG
jgi:hypothetical protein